MTNILILLIPVTLSAWFYLFNQQSMMAVGSNSEMWMPPDSVWQWQISDFIVVYTMWAVMMVAMMLPSIVPMIKIYSRSCKHRYGSEQPYSSFFVLAYLMVWFLFSIVLTLLQWQLHGLQLISAMMENNNTLFAGILFVFAGSYQFAHLKNACLKYCRSPFAFILNSWRPGSSGAFQMGFVHGLTCVGCCWAQMLLMFAVGVMNITAMLLLTCSFLIEKSMMDKKLYVSKGIGVVLCYWGGMFFYNSF